MNTQQLQTFVSLAETLNYHSSAELLQYSPSTLFKHIKLLEEEVGATLFRKKGRNLELTAEGIRLIQPARTLLRYQDEAVRIVQGEAGSLPLRLGGSELITGCCAQPLLDALREAFPALTVQPEPTTNARAADAVRSGAAEAAILCRTSEQPLPGLYPVSLGSEPLCLLTAADSPLAGREGLQPADLAGIPIVDTEPAGCLAAVLLERLQAQGLTPGPVTTAGTLQRAIRRVLETEALLVVPQRAAERLCGEHPLCVLTPAEPLPPCELLLLTAAVPAPAPAALAELARNQAARAQTAQDGSPAGPQ